MGMIFLLVAERRYWQWMEFHPEVRPTLERHLGTDFYDVAHRPHPNQEFSWSLPILYMFESRTNDLIILADATKLNPLLPEACMGANKKRIGVRTEPKDPDLENKELADGIWERVEKVNEGR